MTAKYRSVLYYCELVKTKQTLFETLKNGQVYIIPGTDQVRSGIKKLRSAGLDSRYSTKTLRFCL